MTKRLIPIRGTTLLHSTYVGDLGEITVNTETKGLVVHDGQTAGGFPQLIAQDLVNFQSNFHSVAGIKLLRPVPFMSQNVKGYHTGSSVGGGVFVFNPTRSHADHDGGLVLAQPAMELYDGTIATLAAFLNWTTASPGVGCWERQFTIMLSPELFGATGTEAVTNVTTSMYRAIYNSVGKKFKASGIYSINPLFFNSTTVSDLDLDFKKSTVYVDGVRTLGTTFDWEYGVFSFHGAVDSAVAAQTVTLTATLLERLTNWQVTSSTPFMVGDFWEVEIDPDNNPDNGGNYSTKTVWRLLRVTKIVDSTTVAFDYQRVFDIPIGTKVRYRKVLPVRNVTVRNLDDLRFNLAYTGTSDDKLKASSGVTFYYATNCHVDSLEYFRNPKQAAHFELTNNCSAKNVRMFSPIELSSGGYCVQFEKSIHFSVQDCKSAGDRHLFDATASSNGQVLRCIGNETTNSTFTTHGTYEHDIEYLGCTGHFQLAGSGTPFGQTAMRITLRNHTGTILRANAPNVRDVSIYDSAFTSTTDINLDGLYLKNVQFKNDVRFVDGGNFSKRKNVANNCTFVVGSNFLNAPTKELQAYACNFPNAAIDSFVAGKLVTVNSDFISDSTLNTPITLGLSSFRVRGGKMSGYVFLVTGVGAQDIVLQPDSIDQGNRVSLPLVRTNKLVGSSLRLVYSPLVSTNTDRHITAIDVENTGNLHLVIKDVLFSGGTIRIDTNSVTNGSLIRSGNRYVGTTSTYPPVASNVVVSTEIGLA